MKRSIDSIDRLSVKQITLESKHGSVKLSVGNDGKINFTQLNKLETGSFSIDLKNEKISTKKIEFIKDNSSFTSSLNIGSAGSSNSSDVKFDPSTGRLIEDFLPGDFKNIRDNALEAIGKFDPSGPLRDTNLNQNLLNNIIKGVTAHDKFDITGKLPQENIHDSILDNITKGITAHGKFDADGRLPAVNIHTDVVADIVKGVTAHGKFDINGKLPETNIHQGVLDNISKGVLANSDLLTADIQITSGGNIRFFAGGTRPVSTGVTIDKTHIGLNNVDNLSSTTIIGNTFSHSTFTTIQTTANTANTLSNTIEGRFTGGRLLENNIEAATVTKITNGNSAHSDLNTADISIDTTGKIQFNRGGSRGSSTGAAITKSHIGLPLVENKSAATIKSETFADSIFTTVQSTANTANTLSNTIEGRFSGGLLLETNLQATTVTKITNGNSAHSDLNSADVSIDTSGKIQFNRGGSRGSSTGATLTKSHIGLALAENKSAATIKSETFADTRFANVSSSANTANSTANTINNRFDGNGRIKLSNLTQGSINTNLLYKNNAGLTVNWYTNNAQPQPTTVFNDSLQVYSIATTNTGVHSENFLNGTTYVDSISPINDNGYLGGADGKPFFYLYSKNGEFTNTLTVNNSLGVSQTNIFAYQPINLATAGSVISGFIGDLTIKQPVLNTTTPGNNNTNAGIVMQRNASTNNAWRMFINDNADFVWTYTGATKGYIADGATGGSLNFTGQHRNIPAITEDYLSKIGLIVVSCGEYASTNSNSITINEALPKIKLSTKRNEKSVFGVISNKEDENSNTREFEIGNFVSVNEKPENDNRLIINSIGEGAIWVCNIDGNFENGDYITSCEIPGYGMKQSDDLLHNYTVAKITCHCDFNLQSPIYICEEFEYEGKSYRRAFVGCTYHCG